jgi:cytochrome c oxidase cbb3-type subunit I/II
MPSYPWLIDAKVDTSMTAAKIRAMQTLGVPYADGYDQKANEELLLQGKKIKENLKKDKLEVSSTSEIVALIAYLQRMGTDIKAQPKSETETALK